MPLAFQSDILNTGNLKQSIHLFITQEQLVNVSRINVRSVDLTVYRPQLSPLAYNQGFLCPKLVLAGLAACY
jgi:hypothetical protein